MHTQTNTPNRQSSPADGADRSTIAGSKSQDGPLGALAGRPPLFSGISPGDFLAISAAARVKEFVRGEVLHFEGDPVEQVVLLTSGLVKTTRLGQSGTEVILALWLPGDVLGPADLFGGGRSSTTAQVFRATRALVWDVPGFKALVDRFPAVRQNMLRIVVKYLADLEGRFRELATEKVEQRLARQMLRLLPQIGRPVDGAVEVSLSREELAQMTGTTLFTVSRLLSAWEARGWVNPRREVVTVCNAQALRAIAEDGC